MRSDIVEIEIERLKPNPWNPNVMSTMDYEQLKDSIKITKGKYLEQTPLLIRKVEDTLEIVDGEHRWRAARELGFETIPAHIEDLSEEQVQILCVIRNKTRGQIHYFKFSKLLNQMQNNGKGLTQAVLAQKFGFSQPRIAHILKIFPRLKNYAPAHNLENALLEELARVRQDTLREKLIEKALERNWKRNTVRTHATKFNALMDYIATLTTEQSVKETLIMKLDPNILFHFDLNAIKNEIEVLFQAEQKRRIVHGDMFHEIDQLEMQFDCIIADPPFGLSTVSSGRKFTFATRKAIDQDKGVWDEFTRAEYLEFTTQWIGKVKQVLKNEGTIFIFCADTFLSYIIQILISHGFTHRATIVWHKTNPPTSIMKKTFTSSVEYIIYATNGIPRTFNWLGDNVMHNFIAAPIPAEKFDHPTQKPVKILEKLLKIATNNGDIVLDPFAGTGSTAVACRNLNRSWVVIEKEKKWIKTIEARTQ